MRRKKRTSAGALAVAISMPLIFMQPLGVLAETVSVHEVVSQEAAADTEKEEGRHERIESGKEIGTATPSDAEYVDEDENENGLDGETGNDDDLMNDDDRLNDGDYSAGEDTEEDEPGMEDDLDAEPVRTALPSEAQKATPSEAEEIPQLLSLGDIWGGYTMSAELDGEGTEEFPYLIKSENDLKYVAYHTAEGNVDGFSRCYFKLTTDITLHSGASWIPIGYYWSESDSSPEPFKGNFDGAGHKIRNLNISNSAQTYAGLFGQTMGAEIKDVIVSTSISAGNLCGGIVGEANDTVITGCQVSGTVKAAGIAGGIVGEGYEVVINDCRNTAIVYASEPADLESGESVAAGGIIGSVHNSKVINSANESTESATSIYAEGFAGGIAGNVVASEIYNSYVSGKIGSINAEAIGGIAGRLESGKIKIARMEGSIGKSTSSGLKWAGLYVGYIVDNATQLGPDKDLAYLYTDDEAIYALNPFGNMLNGLIDKNHHIGAYSSTNTVSLYCPVATPKFSLLADTYFYEELEDGVLEVGDDDVYHWAPSRTGAPVRGYRVTVPAVDHGTLSVIESQNPYAKELNWANSGAVAGGHKLLVYAAPVNETEGDVPVYYELIPDSLRWFEEGGSDYGIIRTDASEVSFQMPEKDISLTAEYQAMTNGVILDRTELHFEVEQIRSGSRWEPTVAWRITDPQKLSATVLPASAANKEIIWNVKDTDGSYTDVIEIAQDGMVTVNKDAKWLNDLISSAVSNQLNLYPSKPISLQATNYASATVTASANGSRASSIVTVDFKVTDQTVVPVEGIHLNETGISFEVERILSGNRLNPEVTIKVTPSKRLYADITPAYSTNREITFSHGDGISDMDMITVSPDGLIGVNPEARWIADLVSMEESGRKESPYTPYTAAANRATYVTAAAVDGGKTAVCGVNVNFKTTDQTTVYVEGIKLDKDTLDYHVEVEKNGYRSNPTITVKISEPQHIGGQVFPAEAFNKSISYQSALPGLAAVDGEGNVSVRESSEWIQGLISQNTASGNTEVPVTVSTEDGNFSSQCLVRISYKLTDHTRSSSGGGGGSSSGGGGGGGSSSGGPSRTGGTASAAGGPASMGTWEMQADNQTWRYRHADGTYVSNQWEQVYYNGSLDWYYFGPAGEMMTGWYQDPQGNTFYMNPVSDGKRGRMLTGWNLIDGKWYYFKEISDGTRGALQKDTVTPDHYWVDKDGVWIAD